MIIISHRANLTGPNNLEENTIKQIEYVINTHNLDVEIDIWYSKNKLFLGHDFPKDEVPLSFLIEHSTKLWIHAKNIELLSVLKNYKLNYFWHETDKITITSKGVYWCYPGVYLPEGITVITSSSSIITELNNNPDILGVCTDFPLLCKKHLNESRNS